jgi:hypothetical protein
MLNVDLAGAAGAGTESAGDGAEAGAENADAGGERAGDGADAGAKSAGDGAKRADAYAEAGDGAEAGSEIAGDGAERVDAGANAGDGAKSASASAKSSNTDAEAGDGAEAGSERSGDDAERVDAGANAGDDAACRIEAYDISNYGDENKTASMIVFEDGVPSKAEYRRFLIRSVQGQNDYACLQEALHRRLRNLIDGKAKFAKRPSLILVDGGKGHVSSALEVLGGLGLDIPVAGMAKNDRHETNSIVTAAGVENPLAPFPQLFRLISSIQDEAHRFAISYSKKLSEKRLSLSALDEIRGVGKQRKMALLVHFKSFAHIRDASAEELAKVPGVDERTAGNIYRYFHGDDADDAGDGDGAGGATGRIGNGSAIGDSGEHGADAADGAGGTAGYGADIAGGASDTSGAASYGSIGGTGSTGGVAGDSGAANNYGGNGEV